jgi:hypothetical protein
MGGAEKKFSVKITTWKKKKIRTNLAKPIEQAT